jgi:O-antigen ligase
LIQAEAWAEPPRPRRQLAVISIVGSIVGAIGVLVMGPLTVLLIPAAAAAALATVYMPGVLFATYVLSGVYKAAISPYSPIDVTLILAGLNLLQIVPLLFRRDFHGVSRIGLCLIGGIGFLYLAGVLYTPDQSIGMTDLSTFWLLSLVPMVPAALRVGSRPDYLKQFMWTLFALGIPMTVIGLTQLSDTTRLAEFGASTIEVGRTALLIPLVWAIFILRRKGLLLRALTLALIPAAMVVAIASGSRGPLLALGALAIFGLLRYLTRPGQLSWRVVGMVSGAVLASVIVVSAVSQALPSLSLVRFSLFEDFIGEVANGDLNTSVGDTSSGRRVVLFSAAFSMFEEQPLIGFGTGGYEAASPRFTGPPDYAYPHNAILQFAAEFGLIGVALFLGLIWVALRRPFPRDHLGNAVRITCAYFLLNAMVSDDIYASRPLWGLLIIAVVVTIPRQEAVGTAIEGDQASSPAPPLLPAAGVAGPVAAAHGRQA